MSTSTKCNCCIKEDVCAIKDDYIADCERIKAAIASSATEVSIKCKYQVEHSRTVKNLKQEETI